MNTPASTASPRPLSVLQPETFQGLSLQEKYSPQSSCFGCGPVNAKGLQIRSFPQGDEVVARWTAESIMKPFPGF